MTATNAIDAACDRSALNWLKAKRAAYRAGYADAARGLYRPSEFAEHRADYRAGLDERLAEPPRGETP